MKDWVQQRMIELEEVAGHWQNLIDDYVDQKPPQMPYTKLIPESMMLFNGLIEGWTHVHLGERISLSENFPWVKIELFLHVLAGYLRELVFTQRKVATNDLYDLFNIVYVKPGELYWTEEKFWKNLINNQINFGHYFFSPAR
ncbi:MAG: hypothetical protein IPN20_12580 [Haliscomenobacter sp.]|nr:hypothetical protein [Haliscomenobacter sp.]